MFAKSEEPNETQKWLLTDLPVTHKRLDDFGPLNTLKYHVKFN